VPRRCCSGIKHREHVALKDPYVSRIVQTVAAAVGQKVSGCIMQRPLHPLPLPVPPSFIFLQSQGPDPPVKISCGNSSGSWTIKPFSPEIITIKLQKLSITMFNISIIVRFKLQWKLIASFRLNAPPSRRTRDKCLFPKDGRLGMNSHHKGRDGRIRSLQFRTHQKADVSNVQEPNSNAV
jgi:hypothetical protein